MAKIKKFLIIGIIVYLSGCGLIKKEKSPVEVFKLWREAAKNRNYDKMFQYEWFKYSGVVYAYNKYNAPKRWSNATRREQEEFIKLYKKILKKLLDKKNDDLYEALLRLKDSYQIEVTHYTLNLLKNSADLWVAGDYPGEEKIKLIRVKGRWYLINPFGYQSYLPVTRTLLKKKGIQ